MDIDVNIEKQIAQLQEGRINGSIKPITEISIDPDKQLKEGNLEKGFEDFLANVEVEKEDLGKKIAEEEKKISALEGLFSQLTDKKKPKNEFDKLFLLKGHRTPIFYMQLIDCYMYIFFGVNYDKFFS